MPAALDFDFEPWLTSDWVEIFPFDNSLALTWNFVERWGCNLFCWKPEICYQKPNWTIPGKYYGWMWAQLACLLFLVDASRIRQAANFDDNRVERYPNPRCNEYTGRVDRLCELLLENFPDNHRILDRLDRWQTPSRCFHSNVCQRPKPVDRRSWNRLDWPGWSEIHRPKGDQRLSWSSSKCTWID